MFDNLGINNFGINLGYCSNNLIPCEAERSELVVSGFCVSIAKIVRETEYSSDFHVFVSKTVVSVFTPQLEQISLVGDRSVSAALRIRKTSASRLDPEAVHVNIAEIRYILARKYDRDTAHEYLDWLTDLSVKPIAIGDIWMEAAEVLLKSSAVDIFTPLNRTTQLKYGSANTEESRSGQYRATNISTRFMPLHGVNSSMSLEETVDYLAEELDLERSEHVREVGQSVAELRD